MVEHFIAGFFSLSGWWVAGAVFGFALVECALFFGFIFPAEIAVILGGVLCARGEAALWQALPAAVLGAIIGDSIGYALGMRFGAPFLERKLGSRWRTVQAALQRRGAAAVFFGRFSAFLRAAIPSAAGAAGVPYRTFLLWNVIGGVIWGTGFTLIGYAGGESYPLALKYSRIAGWVFLGVIAVGAVVVALWYRRVRQRKEGTAPEVPR
jgi:membrane protein DedA with SNARE-associated domain